MGHHIVSLGSCALQAAPFSSWLLGEIQDALKPLCHRIRLSEGLLIFCNLCLSGQSNRVWLQCHFLGSRKCTYSVDVFAFWNDSLPPPPPPIHVLPSLMPLQKIIGSLATGNCRAPFCLDLFLFYFGVF